MALPTYTDLKSYLRIEHTSEDALLQQLITRAQGILVDLLHGLPLTTDAFSFIDDSQEGVQFQEPTKLFTPLRPIGGTITVTDFLGNTVDSTTYTVRPLLGIIYANRGYSFPMGPYTISCSAGLQYAKGYSTYVEPLLSSMIIDIAADLYQRRTPAAASEGAAGTTVSYAASAEVITRIMPHVRRLRGGMAVS